MSDTASTNDELRKAIATIKVTQQFTQPKGLVTSNFNSDEQAAIYEAISPFIEQYALAARIDEVANIPNPVSNPNGKYRADRIAQLNNTKENK